MAFSKVQCQSARQLAPRTIDSCSERLMKYWLVALAVSMKDACAARNQLAKAAPSGDRMARRRDEAPLPALVSDDTLQRRSLRGALAFTLS